MAFRRVQEEKEHGFSSHPRGDSGPGDRRWGMMRRGEKKEQGEDSGKQIAASPETKEEEKRKRRERERERGRRRRGGWMDGIETFGNELSEGFIGQGDRFPRVGVGGENSIAAVLRIVKRSTTTKQVKMEKTLEKTMLMISRATASVSAENKGPEVAGTV